MNISIEVLFQLLLFAWFGTVVALNTVFIPQMRRLSVDQKATFIANFFPRLFRTVTIAGAIILLIAGVHFYVINDFRAPLQKAGLTILVMLYLFHVIVEKGLRPIAVGFQKDYTEEAINKFYKYLRFVPRAGLVAITTATTMIML